MIIYKDRFTGDEILSDGWDFKEVDGVVWEVETKKVPKSEDVSGINTGANASAEAEYADEAGGDDVSQEMVYEIVKAFQLQEYASNFTKDEYKDHFKGYVKKVKTAMEGKGADADSVKAFMTGVQKYLKKITKNVEVCERYIGETDDAGSPQGMYILIDYREDGVTPYAIIWKNGLEEMKV